MEKLKGGLTMGSAQLSPDLVNASRKLANLIMQTSVYQQFQQANMEIINNESASSIMNSIKTEQDRLIEISCDREIEEDDFVQLNFLHEKAENDPIIHSYFEAEKNLFKLTQAINNELTSLIGFDFALSILHNEDQGDEAWE